EDRISLWLERAAGVGTWVFFFSSRRRHTSFSRDWSSDVCSSDLRRHYRRLAVQRRQQASDNAAERSADSSEDERGQGDERSRLRSEERRVGKRRRYGMWEESCKRRWRKAVGNKIRPTTE